MEGISLEGLMKQYSQNITNSMFTSAPARIVGTPNLKEQRVDVQILVNKVTTDDVSREHTILLNVPLIFPGSRSSQFSFPVTAGDTVLLVFSQRSIDRFKLGAKTPHTPLDFRKYSRNDAMAIPGLFTFNDAANNPSKRTLQHSTQDTVVVHNIGKSNECEVRLKSSGDVVINTSGKTTINADTAVINADLTVNGAVAFNGASVTHNNKDIGDSHKHSGVSSGSSTTGVPT